MPTSTRTRRTRRLTAVNPAAFTMETAKPEFGMIALTIAKKAPRHSTNMGSFYSISSVEDVSLEVKLNTQDGPRDINHSLLKGWDCMVMLPSDVYEDVMSSFEDHSGATRLTFAFVLAAYPDLMELNDRYPVGHPQEGEDIIGEDGLPVMKLQLKAFVSYIYGEAKVATIPSVEVPKDDKEFEALLARGQQETKARTAQALSYRRLARQQEAGTPAETALS